jgi:hypothetical protein
LLPTGAGAKKLAFDPIVVVLAPGARFSTVAAAPRRVGEGYDGTAMQDRRPGAQFFSDQEFCRHPIRRSAGEVNAEQRHKWQWRERSIC